MVPGAVPRPAALVIRGQVCWPSDAAVNTSLGLALLAHLTRITAVRIRWIGIAVSDESCGHALETALGSWVERRPVKILVLRGATGIPLAHIPTGVRFTEGFYEPRCTPTLHSCLELVIQRSSFEGIATGVQSVNQRLASSQTADHRRAYAAR